MKKILGLVACAVLLGSAAAALAQDDDGAGPPARRAPAGPPMKTTFLRLGRANAVLVEPVTPDPVRGHIVILTTHPEHANNINGDAPFARYGYRQILLNTYGPEITYDEFLEPIAAAIKAARALPGVTKVVLEGHSTGGPELTSYQDAAENGPKGCQGPERIYKCKVKDFAALPKADGVMLMDSHLGAIERTIALNPAVGPHDPRVLHPALDMFDTKNGFDPKTRSAAYSPAFEKTYLAAQRARADELIDEAEGRLAKIEAGTGLFKDDEPFVVVGSDLHINGARLDFADTKLMSHTHAPHMVLKADGTRPVEIVQRITGPLTQLDQQDRLERTVQNITVRTYLSFQAIRLEPNFDIKEDTVTGVDWRSTPNSVAGNLSQIHSPTLVLVSTCAPHVVLAEIAYDMSPAVDKAFVGVEGANHGLQACRPQYGDTQKRAMDYADSWLLKPGRF